MFNYNQTLFVGVDFDNNSIEVLLNYRASKEITNVPIEETTNFIKEKFTYSL